MDVLNTPFNSVLAKTRELVADQPAAVHFVGFDPATREVRWAQGPDYNADPDGVTVLYKFEAENLNIPSFREAWNQTKTEVLRAVEKRDKRFANLG